MQTGPDPTSSADASSSSQSPPAQPSAALATTGPGAGEASPTLDAASASRRVEALLFEMRKVIVGQDRALERMLTCLLCNGHVLLESVPGLAKTLAVETMAKTVGGSFSRIQFTPDLLPADVVGTRIYRTSSERFDVELGPVFANFVLADEINRAPAKVQSALLEVMAEKQVTIGGKRHEVPTPFLVLATQNPIESEGVYPLPEAQRDRFLMKVLVGYPDEEDEARLLRLVTEGRVGSDFVLEHVAQVLTVEDVLALQRVTAGLRVDPAVHAYAVRIARATRDRVGIAHGAGPRATISLIRAAKGRALLEGNAFVTPDDVKRMAPAVLRHRIALAADLEG